MAARRKSIGNSEQWQFSIRVIANGYVTMMWPGKRITMPEEVAEVYHPSVDDLVEHIRRFTDQIPLPAIDATSDTPPAAGGEGGK